MRKTLLATLFLIASCLTLFAQDHAWTAEIGAGYSPMVSQIDNYLQNGWLITGGAGYNFNSGLSATADFLYSRNGIGKNILNGSPSAHGNATIWAITLNPRLPLRYIGSFRPYLVGGVGYYRRSVNFSPFGLGRAGTGGGPGGSLGLGFDINLGDRGFGLFTEARYHYASTGGIPTRMIPVTVGVRW